MRDIRIVHRYAKALLAAAVEQKALSAVEADSQSILQLKSNPDFNNFLANPTIQPRAKAQIFQQLFAAKISSLTLNFLSLLARNQREDALLDILSDFIRRVNERAGIITAYVKTTTPISEDQKARLSQKLSGYSGKTVQIETEIDPDIKGGFIARIEDTIFDGSLATQLNKLREHLVSGERA